VGKQSASTLDNAEFRYDLLDTSVADKVRTAASRIRDKVKKTIEDIIDVGNDLAAAKAALHHGEFGQWLKAEFGWGERTAQNFMSVADRFGSKSEIVADLSIQPTAAYILAAPSVPDEAREKAVSRAESGEQITSAVAKEIVAASRKKKIAKRHSGISTDKLREKLRETLEHYRARWDPKDLATMARHIRDFADSLGDNQRRRGTKSAKD
jgi:hypothetical protein